MRSLLFVESFDLGPSNQYFSVRVILTNDAKLMPYMKADMNLIYKSRLQASEFIYFDKLKRFCISIFTSS
jgi:hypothetical protein